MKILHVEVALKQTRLKWVTRELNGMEKIVYCAAMAGSEHYATIRLFYENNFVKQKCYMRHARRL